MAVVQGHRALSAFRAYVAELGADLRVLAPPRAVPRRVTWIRGAADVVAGFGIAASGLCVASVAWWPW